MASYNGERYIKRQLISILNQLSDNDEIIICDDSSTDNTLVVIDQLCDKRINVFSNSSRSGPVKNFEQAIKLAKGDYIFLADQDDIWLPDKISVTRTLLNEYDLVLTDCWVVNEKDVTIHKSFFKHRGSLPGFWHNFYKNSYMGCCMAFRRDILFYILPFPDKIHMHDWWIGLLVEIKGAVCFYPHPMIKYVRHGNNASPTGENQYGIVKKFKNRLFLLINVFIRVIT